MSDFRYRPWAISIVFICLLNFMVFFVVAISIGGDAVNTKPLEATSISQITESSTGVAAGDAHGGDVYTLDDASKKAGSSSSDSDASKKAGASSSDSDGKWGAAGPPSIGKDPVPDSLFFYKLTTPPEPQINDLGPSTNEPEQKTEDAAVARNDQARFGDDIAQRI